MRGGDGAKPRGRGIKRSAAGRVGRRSGKGKLIAGNGSGGREAPKGKPFQKPFMLFDLQADVGEQNDLAKSNRKKFNELATALRLHYQRAGKTPWQKSAK